MLVFLNHTHQSSPLNLWLHEHELPMVSGNNLSTSSTWARQLRKFQGGKYLIISQWKKLPITYKTFAVHRHHHQHHHKTPANNLAQGHQHLWAFFTKKTLHRKPFITSLLLGQKVFTPSILRTRTKNLLHQKQPFAPETFNFL